MAGASRASKSRRMTCAWSETWRCRAASACRLAPAGGGSETDPTLDLEAPADRGAMNVRNAGGTREVMLGVDEGGGVVSTMTGHDLQLRAGGNQIAMTLKADGRVGIGTAAPVERLDVDARIKAGRLTMGDWPPNASNYAFVGTNALNQVDFASLLRARAVRPRSHLPQFAQDDRFPDRECHQNGPRQRRQGRDRNLVSGGAASRRHWNRRHALRGRVSRHRADPGRHWASTTTRFSPGMRAPSRRCISIRWWRRLDSFQGGSATVMIKSDGRLGIGTANPSADPPRRRRALYRTRVAQRLEPHVQERRPELVLG